MTAGDEDKEDYEERITESFESQLQRYFHNVSNHLNLDKTERSTNPIKYDRVKWLVRWTVESWSKDQILQEIADTTDKFIIQDTVDKAFRQFKEYDLPVRA